MADDGSSASDSAGAGRRRRRRRRRRPAEGTKGGGAKGGGAKGGATGSSKSASKSAAKGGSKSAAKGGSKQRARSGGRGRKSGSAKTDGRRKIRTTTEVSAGGVVYRRTDDGLEVVLASRRTRRGDLAWGLAKGGIEDGETKEQAAIREVREETGLTATIEADLGDTKYMYVWEDVRIRKTVHFFLMRWTGGDPGDRDDEMEEIRWFPMERAMKRAAYRGERDILARAAELLA
jgi:8-oxo-dGTP pyrophosphatase MutT (NUDIX family)